LTLPVWHGTDSARDAKRRQRMCSGRSSGSWFHHFGLAEDSAPLAKVVADGTSRCCCTLTVIPARRCRTTTDSKVNLRENVASQAAAAVPIPGAHCGRYIRLCCLSGEVKCTQRPRRLVTRHLREAANPEADYEGVCNENLGRTPSDRVRTRRRGRSQRPRTRTPRKRGVLLPWPRRMFYRPNHRNKSCATRSGL
jgi:hypothetical protein